MSQDLILMQIKVTLKNFKKKDTVSKTKKVILQLRADTQCSGMFLFFNS